jgi:hypothetical protein
MRSGGEARLFFIYSKEERETVEVIAEFNKDNKVKVTNNLKKNYNKNRILLKKTLMIVESITFLSDFKDAEDIFDDNMDVAVKLDDGHEYMSL